MKDNIVKLKKMVDSELKKYLKDAKEYPKIIYKAMRYSVFAGGKRLRPILTLLSAKLCGLNYKDALPVACGIEMIHTYSLIHDDLPAMDNDDYRRGKLTSHKKFGEAIAILTGDALLTKGFETILNSYKNKKIKSKNVILATLEIAKGAGIKGMIGGQVVDILSEGKKVSKSILNYLHTHKTGSLIKSSIMSGAILADADNTIKNSLRIFSEKIGLAFQIIDDILDITGDEKKLGKTKGKDLKEKKITYPSLYGIDKSKEIAKKLIIDAKKILKKMNKNTSDLEYIADYFISRTY